MAKITKFGTIHEDNGVLCLGGFTMDMDGDTTGRDPQIILIEAVVGKLIAAAVRISESTT